MENSLDSYCLAQVFEYGTQPKTAITREYPANWKRGDEPYYPINDEKSNVIYQKYLEEAKDILGRSQVP